jgi:hypothetical protein
MKVKFYNTIVFYTFLGIQGHIICYFWTYRTKDKNFLSLVHFLSIFNLTETFSDVSNKW